jgi:hypothetical protein
VKPGGFKKLRSGLEVYEDRHCNGPVPLVGNTPPTLPDPTEPLPDLPVPIPTVVPTLPEPQTPEALQDLVSDDLLQRIIEFGFGGQNGGAVPAPPCRNQGPYTYGGETSQYPHVKAGTGR